MSTVDHREYAQHKLVHPSFFETVGKGGKRVSLHHKPGAEVDFYHPSNGDKTSGVVVQHQPGSHITIKENKGGLLGKGKTHRFNYATKLPETQHTEQPSTYTEHLKQGGLPHEYKDKA